MPKISKQGPSWENDPPRVPEQRDAEQSPSAELGGLEEVQHVEPVDNYDDKVAWPYADLQQESRNRWSEAPVNGVPREELIERLRADDAKK